jgi:hypothetical protein
VDEAFAERWARKEREHGLDVMASGMVACDAWVLPRDPGLCLTFKEAARPPRIWEVYGHPSDWSDADRVRLSPYRMIGSDGADNPLCVEDDTGAVWLLDHEDGFRSREFVNSGIPQLAECMLAYLGEDNPERFRKAVRSIDPPAMVEGSFWSCEALGLEGNG